MISDEKKKEERSIMYDQETCLYNFQENTKKVKKSNIIQHSIKLIEKVSFTIFKSCNPLPKSLSVVRDEGK